MSLQDYYKSGAIINLTDPLEVANNDVGLKSNIRNVNDLVNQKILITGNSILSNNPDKSNYYLIIALILLIIFVLIGIYTIIKKLEKMFMILVILVILIVTVCLLILLAYKIL